MKSKNMSDLSKSAIERFTAGVEYNFTGHKVTAKDPLGRELSLVMMGDDLGARIVEKEYGNGVAAIIYELKNLEARPVTEIWYREENGSLCTEIRVPGQENGDSQYTFARNDDGPVSSTPDKSYDTTTDMLADKALNPESSV